MVSMNCFRIKNAVKNLEEQKAIIKKDRDFFVKWKPVILSLIQEYLGEEDDIYKAISEIQIASYDPQKVTIDYYEGYISHTKGVVIKYIDDAIVRVKQGRIQPQKHNFFARIPIQNSIPIFLALALTPAAFTYNWGKDNGKSEFQKKVEQQSLDIESLKQKNTALSNTLVVLRDSLTRCITHPEH
jgi:hypothetical protein